MTALLMSIQAGLAVTLFAYLLGRSRPVALLAGAIVLGGWWLALPTVALWHPGMLLALMVVAIAGNVGLIIHEGGGRRRGDRLRSLATYGLCLAVIGIPPATTWSLFHGQSYQGLLAVEEAEFEPSAVLLDQSQARLVDQGLADRAAQELIGNQRGLGSQARVGTMSIQEVDGRLWWVGALEHRGPIKYLLNTTTPGYVMVSASDYSDRRIILDRPIRYGAEGFYLNGNVRRHLYNNGYWTVGLMDPTFEIDDAGTPHWVVTRYRNMVGFSGAMATGTLIVNATTGEISEHGLEDTPAWVDRIQPEALVRERLGDWGRLVHGFWNAHFAQRDVITPSPGMRLVYTADGRAAWYTGLQSAGGSDEGTMGFALIDSRTGEATFYRRAGVTESAAAAVIEGQVQEMRYSATDPIPYVVHGVPTFIAALKDSAGNPQGVGMVAYDDRTRVGTGGSLRTALRRYTASLDAGRGALALDARAERIRFTGTVERAALEQIDGRGLLYLTIDAVPGRYFTAQAEGEPAALLTRVGDQVAIEVLQGDLPIIPVIAFENLSLSGGTHDGADTIEPSGP
ncbi:hypothetical protein J2T57_001681 [Natronocella acetinitrilica]|uniref:Uncharacterized protein n=1 Tax=Natronocella acetinitrilica TaxID=414046 RepID=A0AAE3G3U2_9GAMM|nr:hypothetical protein [Natronocella acetinitrilica]MCP1674579.1 hypothetical protein [Natronocella acetinitrilica]